MSLSGRILCAPYCQAAWVSWGGGGGMLPGAHPARYFCIYYPGFNPRSTLPQRSPPKSTTEDRKPSLQSLLYKSKCPHGVFALCATFMMTFPD